MKTVLNRQPIFQLLMSISLGIFSSSAFSHHPHDLVDALAVSPNYKTDKTLYIASTGHVLKSVNGGYGWQELVNGLDHTSAVSSILVTRSNGTPGVLLVATEGNGIYRSTNSGASWKNSSQGLEGSRITSLSGGIGGDVLAIDSSGHLYISTDSGETWNVAAIPKTAIITAADVSAGKVLAGDNSGNLYSSSNNSTHLRKLAQLPGNPAITTINLDANDSTGNTYYVGTRKNGLYKTADNGNSFQPAGKALEGHHIISLAIQPDFIIATTWEEASFISNDHGQSWGKYGDGLLTDEQANTVKYHSPQFRKIAVADDEANTLFLAGFTGLFKSANHGKSWKELETLPVSLIKGLDVSPSDGDDYSVAITTYGGGAYFSHDKGNSWIIANKGLNTTRLMDIHYSPTYPVDQTVFSGSVGLLLKSTDKNGSWEQIPVSYRTLKNRIIGKLMRWGLPRDIGNSYLNRQDRVPVYPVVMSPSTHFSTDKTVLFGTRWHGLYRSDEGGKNAYSVWLHTAGAITGLTLSPNFSNDHTVFAYVRGDGIYKSVNTGDDWKKITKDLPADATSGVETGTHSASEDYTVAFSPGYANDKTVFAAGPSGLYKSTDQGENWIELKSDTLGKKPHIIAFALSPDYVNDKTMIISLKGRGLYKTVDGGQHFTRSGRSLIENNHAITRMVFSSYYAHNGTIFAASSQNLFRSTNGGDNWTLLPRPVRYEDHRDVIRYTGNWSEARGNNYSATHEHYSEQPGASVSLDFTGCGIRWIASTSPLGGQAKVFIDDAPVATVDLNTDKQQAMSVVFSITSLLCGPHSIRIESGSTKRVTFDAFDVLPVHPVVANEAMMGKSIR